MNYGRYQIIREVGRGAMGVVYEARDPNIDRIVALKVLRQDRTATETFVKRFIKEAKVIGRLSHPHIVTVYDVGEDNGTVYIAMEFLEGVPLSDLIHKTRLEVERVVDIGIQMATTLEYAHQKGVIHRDIKPSNIIVLPDGQIKVTDFGIAHIEDPSSTLQTQAGEIMGTPAYMSPEQVQGHPVDNRADIFSLGIILYELSTGMRPFGGEGKGLATIFNEIMQMTPHEPDKESPSIPQGLSHIIMKALEKNPENRFQTGKELADELQHCFKEVETVPNHPEPPPGKTIKHGIGMWIFAIVAAALVSGGIYFFSQHNQLPPEQQQTKSEPAKPGPPPVDITPHQVPPVPIPIKPPPVTAAPVTAAPVPATPTPAPQRTDIKKVETKPPEIPKKTATKSIAPLSQPSTPRPLPRFAFLKVHSTPKGASVLINGTRKGVTPLTMKLGLGEYQVRLSYPGYKDSEHTVKLEKMTEYPLTEKLKPIK